MTGPPVRLTPPAAPAGTGRPPAAVARPHRPLRGV